MKHDRLSIHISDDAEITVEERKNGVKKVKNISLNDLLICIKSCIKEIKPVYRAVLPKKRNVLQLLTRNRRFLGCNRISVQQSRYYIYGYGVSGLSSAEVSIRL